MNAPIASRCGWTASALVAALVGGLVHPGKARADRPTPEMRARVEDAFVEGRLDGIEALAAPGEEPVSIEPLAVRDLFWRPVAGARTWQDPRLDVDPSSVSARRLAWLRAQAAARGRGEPLTLEPYPLPAAGEEDPYPRITAWVRDRLLRETAGTSSIDRDGPLGDLEDDELSTYFVRTFRQLAFAGPGSETEQDDASRAKQRAVREGVVNARTLALCAVGFWVAVGGLLLLRRRGLKLPPPGTDA